MSQRTVTVTVGHGSAWLYDGPNEELLYVTPHKRSRALPEKLTVPQLVKKFHAFYGNRSFITAFRSPLPPHLSLSWARKSQSMPLHSTSWRSILIVAFHRRLGLSLSFIYIYMCVCVCVCVRERERERERESVSVFVCVCVCVCNRTFPSRLCSSPWMI